MNKTCVIITGPTAVGKTAVAVELAKHFSTDIISADSRQCYIELNIGVAKPRPDELSAARHYFINSHHITDNLNAADFEAYALGAVHDIFTRSDIAVMVGGTGLYIRAFCEGLDPVPPTAPLIRESLQKAFDENGIGFLQSQVQQLDPLYYREGEIHNPQRLMRALEVMIATGRSIRSFQAGGKKKRDFSIVMINLELPRDILYARINARVDQMMAEGLLEEARGLWPYRHLNALQTVGYRELFEYFEESVDKEDPVLLSKAVEKIKQNTRHYAKRQMTWFRREPGIISAAPDPKQVIRVLSDILT